MSLILLLKLLGFYVMAMGPSFYALQMFYALQTFPANPNQGMSLMVYCSTTEIWTFPVRETALIILLFSDLYVWKVEKKKAEE